MVIVAKTLQTVGKLYYLHHHKPDSNSGDPSLLREEGCTDCTNRLSNGVASGRGTLAISRQIGRNNWERACSRFAHVQFEALGYVSGFGVAVCQQSGVGKCLEIG